MTDQSIASGQGGAVQEAPIRILLVEDEVEVRSVSEGVLSSFGWEVCAVSNGAEAIEAIKLNLPDLVLSDLRMPVMDGYELLEKIRANPLWYRIPFVIVSAKAESADLRMGMSLGADDYLAKPYKASDLRAAIEVRVMRSRKVAEAIAGNQWLLTHILPHELRTPLMSVIGYADMMVDAANDGTTLNPGELHEYGRTLQTAGARIYGVVENLLFWARLNAPADPADDAARRNELVRSADVEKWGLAIARRYARSEDLVVDVPPEVAVRSVTRGIEFVTRHLVENAFKYSYPRTQVRVTGTISDRRFILKVSDSGRGMSPELIARLARDGEIGKGGLGRGGSGMGLMLATMFADRSGGSLEIRAGGLESGTSVTLNLPISSPDSKTPFHPALG